MQYPFASSDVVGEQFVEEVRWYLFVLEVYTVYIFQEAHKLRSLAASD